MAMEFDVEIRFGVIIIVLDWYHKCLGGFEFLPTTQRKPIQLRIVLNDSRDKFNPHNETQQLLHENVINRTQIRWINLGSL
jgi:hypothetical protein